LTSVNGNTLPMGYINILVGESDPRLHEHSLVFSFQQVRRQKREDTLLLPSSGGGVAENPSYKKTEQRSVYGLNVCVTLIVFRRWIHEGRQYRPRVCMAGQTPSACLIQLLASAITKHETSRFNLMNCLCIQLDITMRVRNQISHQSSPLPCP
jgi:hypothetical protein